MRRPANQATIEASQESSLTDQSKLDKVLARPNEGMTLDSSAAEADECPSEHPGTVGVRLSPGIGWG